MTSKIFNGKVVLLKMNYLIKIFLVIFIFYSNEVHANDNKILFQVNNKIYTTIDLKNRIEYLEIINSKDFSSVVEFKLIDDYFKSAIFFEYVNNNDFLKNILKKESKIIFNQIINKNIKLKENLNDNTIFNNIEYDLARKIVLENILDDYREYIFSNPEDINFIYNYKIKYITIPIENLLSIDEFDNIINSLNFNLLKNYLIENKIEYHLEEIEIKDLNKINNQIKYLLNSSNQFIFENNSDFYRILKLDKKLDISDGVYYRLLSIETINKLESNQQNCRYVKSLQNIRSAKEYEFNKLNDTIKNNLISIDDFIIFKDNDLFNYIFLCEVRVNEEFLKEININKKINFVAKNIELEFINKFSKLYNTNKYYE